jgi:hypothetical protein
LLTTSHFQNAKICCVHPAVGAKVQQRGMNARTTRMDHTMEWQPKLKRADRARADITATTRMSEAAGTNTTKMAVTTLLEVRSCKEVALLLLHARQGTTVRGVREDMLAHQEPIRQVRTQRMLVNV